MSEAFEPKIVAFLCNWCSYAGADLAGVSRLQYPPNIRVVRVPCSGRINPLFILAALQNGADGVLVSGCHPGDCHYLSGNLVARRKFNTIKDLLAYVGIEPKRVQFSWVSASEGGRFSDLVRQVSEDVKKLGPQRRLVQGDRMSADADGGRHPQRGRRVHCWRRGRSSLLVGYERGSDGYRCRPSFAARAEDVDRLEWDSTCSNNLAVYLPGLFQRPPQKKGQETPLPRIGFVAKACDLRSIVALVKERQAPRENLVLIGVPCTGMVDERKVREAVGGAEIASFADDGDNGRGAHRGRRRAPVRARGSRAGCLPVLPVPRARRARTSPWKDPPGPRATTATGW